MQFMKNKGIVLIAVLVLTACNSVKYVPENKELLTKTTVIIDTKKSTDLDISTLITQKANTKRFGIPIGLYFYNLGNPNKPQTPSEWGKQKPKTYTFIKRIFSEKQSISYANSMIGINNWFLRGGEAPTLIDNDKTKKTLANLEAYFKTKGYFKASATAKQEQKAPHRGETGVYWLGYCSFFVISTTPGH